MSMKISLNLFFVEAASLLAGIVPSVPVSFSPEAGCTEKGC